MHQEPTIPANVARQTDWLNERDAPQPSASKLGLSVNTPRAHKTCEHCSAIPIGPMNAMCSNWASGPGSCAMIQNLLQTSTEHTRLSALQTQAHALTYQQSQRSLQPLFGRPILNDRDAEGSAHLKLGETNHKTVSVNNSTPIHGASIGHPKLKDTNETFDYQNKTI